MDKREEVISMVTDVAEDVESRMENIKAVKGQVFLDCVEFMLACHSIMGIGGSGMLVDIRRQILSDMISDLSAAYLKKTLSSKEEQHEVVMIAKNINDSLSSHAERVMEMLEQFKASGD